MTNPPCLSGVESPLSRKLGEARLYRAAFQRAGPQSLDHITLALPSTPPGFPLRMMLSLADSLMNPKCGLMGVRSWLFFLLLFFSFSWDVWYAAGAESWWLEIFHHKMAPVVAGPPYTGSAASTLLFHPCL